MAAIRDLYDNPLTTQSQKELVKFAKWFHKKNDTWPSVIGGWAVWAYYKNGFGSRDVDLILPSDDWIENIMKKEYFPNNGFRAYDYLKDYFIEKHYGKPINPDNPDDDIVFFDLLSGSRLREDPEKLGVIVDWNWVNTFKNEIKMDDAIIIVPEIELLILLKIIGALARIRTLHAAHDRTYWVSKIWKDYYDVANLTSHIHVDEAKLTTHISNTKLTRILREEFLAGYISRKDVLEETKTTLPKIEKILLPDKRTKKRKTG